MSASVLAVAPTLAVVNGIPTTTSNDVAAFFHKRHDHVLRDIEALRADLPENARPNFGASEYTDSTGRTLPAYRLTRDGFTLLAMGFTGKRALAFKLAYIDAFNRMEQQQQQPPAYALRRRRWLFSIDCTGKEQVVMVPWDCAVIRQEEIPGLIAQGEIDKPELLGKIGAACIARLSSNVAYREAA